jgi:hypothetical protein
MMTITCKNEWQNARLVSEMEKPALHIIKIIQMLEYILSELIHQLTP